MQENFDPLGRWRTLDNGLPIDTSVSVDFLDEGPLTASTPVDALKGFTSSMRFKQCFVRQVFRFYTGRDETPADDPVLRQMFFGFANNDEQAIVDLLRVLASSTELLSANGDAMITREMLKARGMGKALAPASLIKRFGFAGVPAHAGGARDGLHRGRHVRRRAALPDVLQGRIVPPGARRARRRSAAWPARRSRRCSRTLRTSSCSRA